MERSRDDMLALPTVPVKQRGRLAPARDGDDLVHVAVDSAGDPIALWCARDDVPALTATTTVPGEGTFLDSRSPRPVAARVTIHRPANTDVVEIPGLELAHPTVQPLPGDRILVVGVRCVWRPGGPEHNAVVYDRNGRVLIEKTLGDGIGHVLATPAGAVWVGYTDEGVFGTYGWDDPGSTPIGEPGLIRFTPGLDIDWRYPLESALGSVDDCYALNLDGETAWSCYFGGDDEFPLVRIGNGELKGWHNRVAAGARALVVDGPAIGLYGGYGAEHDRLVLAEIRAEDLAAVAEFRLVLPDGSPMPVMKSPPHRSDVRILGRGADLHVFHGRRWYSLSLKDLASATGVTARLAE